MGQKPMISGTRNLKENPIQIFFVNPFVPNASFLYPLKTSENLTVF